jgi:hypothetical protein
LESRKLKAQTQKQKLGKQKAEMPQATKDYEHGRSENAETLKS